MVKHIVVQTAFDIVGSCVVRIGRDCCEDLVLMQCIVCEALVLLRPGVMHVRLLRTHKALCLMLLHCVQGVVLQTGSSFTGKFQVLLRCV